jgi:hypothetical protein
MPLAFRPGEPLDADPAPAFRSASTDSRVRPYDGGYDVMRGYEAPPAPASPARDGVWLAARGRRRR